MKLDSSVITAAFKSVNNDKIAECLVNFPDDRTAEKIINAIFRKEKLTLNNIDYKVIKEKLSYRRNVEIKSVKITNPIYGEIEVAYTYNDVKYYDNPEFEGEGQNYEDTIHTYEKVEDEKSDSYSFIDYFN